MRVFSYVYHGLLGLFLLALSCVTLLSGNHNLRLDMLPWKGAALTYALLALGVVALVCVVLAVKGMARVVFFVWTLAVLVMMFRGYFIAGYVFSGPGEFRTAVYLTLGAIASAIGGWFVFRREPERKLAGKSWSSAS
ncbi:MAG: hypothetical protein ACE15B_12740 [Bryobacteraceae bacterium]